MYTLIACSTISCQVVGVGNGVGCRETEEFFDLHIRKGTFQPLNVVFWFVCCVYVSYVFGCMRVFLRVGHFCVFE